MEAKFQSVRISQGRRLAFRRVISIGLERRTCIKANTKRTGANANASEEPKRPMTSGVFPTECALMGLALRIASCIQASACSRARMFGRGNASRAIFRLSAALRRWRAIH